MSRDFKSNNIFQSIEERIYYRYKWDTEAYTENDGLGEACIKDTLFVERLHYGAIDHENNSIIPNEEYLVSTRSGRVFDFVADSYSLMQLNFRTALERGIVSNAGSSFGNLQMLSSYSNPRLKYGRYLEGIFQFYNKTYIPNTLGITSIASYEDYVKNFFILFTKDLSNIPLTLTKWNTSLNSSIFDTGLSFSYADISFSDDQRKIDEIIDHPCFEYIKNLALNMSFSIVHNNPNIMLYDLNSPAGASIRNSYNLYNLSSIFNKRYIKTYSLDNNELYNNININYNKYVFENTNTRNVYVKCGKTISENFNLQPTSLTSRPYTDLEEVWYYIRIRNVEEGNVFRNQTLDNIFKKAKYFYKKLDKESAMGYINSMFRDQVWNKNNGFHDFKSKLEGRTQTESQRQQAVGGPSSGGSSY